jgi:hypothetical protein
MINLFYHPLEKNVIYFMFVLLSSLFFVFQSDTVYCYCDTYADSLYSNGDFKEAIIYYKQNIPSNRDLFIIGCCYVYINDFDSACKYFIESAENSPLYETSQSYFSAIEHSISPGLFDVFSKSNQWQKLKDSIIQRLDFFIQKQNKELQKMLHNMKLEDQYMRHKGYDSVFACCPEQVGSYWYKIDSMNVRKLYDIIDKYGYPDRKIVGFDGEDNAWLIAQHADHDTNFQIKVLRLIYENLKSDGSVNPHHYPYLLDRILVNKGLKQIFGTQMDNDASGLLVPQPIDNEMAVNNLRRCFGLSTLQEYINFMRKR